MEERRRHAFSRGGSRIDSRGHQLRKSSRRKEQRRAIHVTLPNCGTGVQNPLTLPYVSQLHGTKQRPVLLSSSLPPLFLLSTVPSFFLSLFSSPGRHPRHGCRCPATVLRTKQSRKFACASTLWIPAHFALCVQRENCAAEISMDVARRSGACTRMRRGNCATVGRKLCDLVDRVIHGFLFRIERNLVSSSGGVLENIAAGGIKRKAFVWCARVRTVDSIRMQLAFFCKKKIMGREYRLGQLVDWFPLPFFFLRSKGNRRSLPLSNDWRQYDLSMANLRELESWEHRCNVTLVTYQPFLMSTLGKYRTKSWFAKLHKSSFLPSLILLPLFFAFISNSSREESTPHNRKGLFL